MCGHGEFMISMCKMVKMLLEGEWGLGGLHMLHADPLTLSLCIHALHQSLMSSCTENILLSS